MKLSIIIPTYEEPGIGHLLELIDEVAGAAALDCEAIVVDDSPTRATADVADAAHVSFSVRPVYRPASPTGSWGGLSGAVLDGLGEARAEIALVMDGDGQHPPDAIPALVAALDGADLAIASRYCGTGQATGLAGGYRRAVSSASTALARGLFPRRVGTRTTDPMTGFFAVRLDSLDQFAVAKHAIGFKVLLAILVTHPALRVAEVPFVFGERADGESKAGLRNGAAFLRQVVKMRVAA